MTTAKARSVCARSCGFGVMGHVLRSGFQVKCLVSCMALNLRHDVVCDSTL